MCTTPLCVRACVRVALAKQLPSVPAHNTTTHDAHRRCAISIEPRRVALLHASPPSLALPKAELSRAPHSVSLAAASNGTPAHAGRTLNSVVTSGSTPNSLSVASNVADPATHRTRTAAALTNAKRHTKPSPRPTDIRARSQRRAPTARKSTFDACSENLNRFEK